MAGAKDWWRDNLIVPGLFRDYFAERERLGDAPVFGSALTPRYASPPAADQGVPRARRTTRSRRRSSPARQRSQRASVDRTFLASFGRFWADAKAPTS